MENFYIQGDAFIPLVDFNAEKNVLTVKSDSFGEHTALFFEPLLDWMKRYRAKTNAQICIMAHLKQVDFEKLKDWLGQFELKDSVQLIWKE